MPLLYVFAIVIAITVLSGCSGRNDTGDNVKIIKEEADYSEYFNGAEGTVVFYSTGEKNYSIYNMELANLPSSPCSSFKIVSCLMGLESGVINPSESTMQWNGTSYPVAGWNQDIGYKQAFQTSCIWYFRKVIDMMGEDYVQGILNELNYGNCDVSEWEGSMNNLIFPDFKEAKELNGFWQESSLKISPRQQVDIVKKIFEDKDIFSAGNLDLMKEVMLIDNAGSFITIYGKTGSGIKDDNWADAWFVGMFEIDGATTYFAARLNQPDARGAQAEEIVLDIINGEFRIQS